MASKRFSRRLFVGSLTLSLAGGASAQCDDWVEGFRHRGVGGPVMASTVWNRAGVDHLVLVSGYASTGGDFGWLQSWTGGEWELPGGYVYGLPRALATFDDGAGPVLYVGGEMTDADGIAVSGVARWDGTTWSDVGGGVSGVGMRVNALAVFDDGNGDALYAAGVFSSAGGGASSNIAKWDGANWSPLGAGPSNGLSTEVLSLAVFDDGAGPKLVAGRALKPVGGTDFDHLSVWDGASWSAFPAPLASGVRALGVFDLGVGPQLYAAREYAVSGGEANARVAHWTGSSWANVGNAFNGPVRTLAAHDAGAGKRLFAGGDFSFFGNPRSIAEWNGTSWTPAAGGVSEGTSSPVNTLIEYRLGAERVLVSAGQFGWLGSVQTFNAAYLYRGAWRGMSDLPAFIAHEMLQYDDGTGPALYAATKYRSSYSDSTFHPVLKWDGATWSTLPGSPRGEARALLVHDDGGGPKLYVGGNLLTPAGLREDVQVWDGSTWSVVGPMPDFFVLSLAWFDSGSGPMLYAGGQPVFTAGVPSIPGLVIRWNGQSWSAFGGPNDWVYALEVFDDGSGPALYAGGNYSTAGVSGTRSISRWNGAAWSSVGNGVGSPYLDVVYALRAWDDGSGPALYMGGRFLDVGGVPAAKLARWNGSTWSTMGNPNDTVNKLIVDVGASPPSLLAAGDFRTIAGQTTGGIARWDGANWSSVGGSVPSWGPYVHAVANFDDGDGVDLHISGQFQLVGANTPSYNYGIWNRCAGPGEPYCFGDSVGQVCTCVNSSLPGAQGGCTNSTGEAARLLGAGTRSYGLDDQSFSTQRLPPGKSCILFVGDQATNGGAGALFDDGLRCAGGTTRRLGLRVADSFGHASWGPGLAAQGGWFSGDTRYFQVWYRDPTGPCGRSSNLSNGYRIEFLP